MKVEVPEPMPTRKNTSITQLTEIHIKHINNGRKDQRIEKTRYAKFVGPTHLSNKASTSASHNRSERNYKGRRHASERSIYRVIKRINEMLRR